TTDEGTYLAELKSRLDAIEEIKRIHDIEIARCRRRSIVASVCGIAIGAVVVAFIILQPVAAPKLNTAIIASVLSFVAQWKTFIFTGIAISALVLGLIPWGKSKTHNSLI
ncbi:MAG: hypothetical protein KBS58_06740, partial [Bacteroidales bacterium]|nr:hypothetical protein [Candidatus Cacconaster equi]